MGKEVKNLLEKVGKFHPPLYSFLGRPPVPGLRYIKWRALLSHVLQIDWNFCLDNKLSKSVSFENLNNILKFDKFCYKNLVFFLENDEGDHCFGVCVGLCRRGDSRSDAEDVRGGPERRRDSGGEAHFRLAGPAGHLASREELFQQMVQPDGHLLKTMLSIQTVHII